MALIVPSFLQRLFDHHQVDTEAFAREVEGIADGRMRTAGWAGTAQKPRHVLATIPGAFPRFKAVVKGEELLIEGLGLGPARIETLQTMGRLKMPDEGLPETIIAALPGQRLARLVGHEAIGDDIVIKEARRIIVDEEPWLDIIIDAPRAVMVEMSRSPGEPLPQVDIAALIARTHVPVDPAWVIGEADTLDTRKWQVVLNGIEPAIGLRRAAQRPHEPPGIDLRFAYDKAMVAAVGKGGFGAWFDRRVYAWRVGGEADALEALSQLIGKMALLVIDEKGRVHVNRNDALKQGAADQPDHDKSNRDANIVDKKRGHEPGGRDEQEATARAGRHQPANRECPPPAHASRAAPHRVGGRCERRSRPHATTAHANRGIT